MAALRRLDLAHLLPELYHLPRVAAGQGGVIGPWQVPRDTLGLGAGLGNVDVALQNTVAEGIFLKQLQTLLIGEMTSSFFRHNLFYGIISTETINFLIFGTGQLTYLTNVGCSKTSCQWPGDNLVLLILKLFGVFSGAPIKTLKSLKQTS